LGFIPTLDDGECFHDVVHVVAVNPVDVEVGGVEFTTKEEPPLFIPVEWWAAVATVFGKRIPGPRRYR
jgi:hypothetical protein